MADAQSIAAQLQGTGDTVDEAALQVLGPLYADQIELAHEPRSEADGVVARQWLLDVSVRERDTFAESMPDVRREATWEARGDDVVARRRVRGTTPDGKALDFDSEVTYVLRGGVITRISVVSVPDDDPG